MRKMIYALFLSILITSVFANTWYSFKNNFAADKNAEIKVFYDGAGDGIADPNKDVNVIIYMDVNKDGIFDYNFFVSGKTQSNSDGNYVKLSFDLNHNGKLDLNGADFNIFIEPDNNAEKAESFVFYNPGFKDADINWHMAMPLSKGSDLNFNFIYYDANGNKTTYNGDFNISLIGPDGSKINSYPVHGSDTVNITSNDLNEVGQYKIIVGDDEEKGGYKTFTFDVLSFYLIAYVVDEDSTSKSSFSTTDKIYLVVYALNKDQNQVILLNDLNYSLDGGDATPVSNISLNNKISLSTQKAGSHTIKVSASDGNNIQSISFDFFVADYTPFFLLAKNSVLEKEKLFGAFSPGSNVVFYFGVRDSNYNTDSSISRDENCSSLIKSLTYRRAGLKAEFDANYFKVGFDNERKLCHLQVNAPQKEGDYVYKLVLNNSFSEKYTGLDLTREEKLKVQKYSVFLEPFDVSISDLKKASKFLFFDENIGLLIKAIDLSNGKEIDLNILDVNYIVLNNEGSTNKLANASFDFNNNYGANSSNVINISSSANISGGFNEVKAVLDLNDGSQIEAFGAFEKHNFEVIADLNMDFPFDGPPVARPDENFVIKVAVKSAAGKEIKYANVSLLKILRVNDMNTIYGGAQNSFNPLNTSATTNEQGIAYLNLGPMGKSGNYEITLKVENSQNSETIKTYFEVHSFMTFAMPVEVQSSSGNDYNVLENLYQKSNTDVNLAVFVPSRGGFEDYNSFEIGDTVKVFKMDEKLNGMKEMKFNVASKGKSACWLMTDQNFSFCALKGQLITIHNAEGFESGEYIAMIDVNLNSSISTASAFFVIQPYTFQVCNKGKAGSENCGASLQKNEGNFVKAAPDSNVNFFVNLGTDTNAEKNTRGRFSRIALLDAESFTPVFGFDDLNYYSGSLLKPDLNSDFNDFNVYLPNGLPSGEYVLSFDFNGTNDGTNYTISNYKRYVSVDRYSVLVPTFYDPVLSKDGFYMPSEIEYAIDYEKFAFDTNIEDNKCPKEGNYIWDLNGNSYDYFVLRNENDFNMNILVDKTNGKLIFDDLNYQNNDCNFANGFVYNISDFNSLPLDDNTPVIFTKIGATSLLYIRYNTNGSNDGLITSFDNKQGFGDNFVGEFDLDSNVVIPLLINDANGSSASGTVNIEKIIRLDFVNGGFEKMDVSQNLGFNINSGLAVLDFDLNALTNGKTGEFQLLLSISDGTNKETLPPWKGPIFSVHQYQGEAGIVSSDRFNNGYDLVRADLNVPLTKYFSSSFEGLVSNGAIAYMLDMNETDLNIDLQNDGDKNDVLYLVYFPYNDSYMVDDDTNTEFDSNDMHLSYLSPKWALCAGDYDYNALFNDCSGNAIAVQNPLIPSSIDFNLLDYHKYRFGNYTYLGTFDNFDASDNRPNGWESKGSSFKVVNNAGDNVASFNGNEKVHTLQMAGFFLGMSDSIATVSFDANADVDTNIYLSVYYDGNNNGNNDGNVYYDFNTNSWDVNTAFDINRHAYSCQITANFFSTCDVNINFSGFNKSTIALGFSGDSDPNHHYQLDGVDMNYKLFTLKGINFYRKIDFRPSPSDLMQYAGGFSLWIDRNWMYDYNNNNNLYMELQIYDRRYNTIDINSNNSSFTATVLKESSCGMDSNGPMQPPKFLGSINTSAQVYPANSVDLNLGSLIADNLDSNCNLFRIRFDVNVNNITDSFWKDLYVR